MTTIYYVVEFTYIGGDWGPSTNFAVNDFPTKAAATKAAKAQKKRSVSGLEYRAVKITQQLPKREVVFSTVGKKKAGKK